MRLLRWFLAHPNSCLAPRRRFAREPPGSGLPGGSSPRRRFARVRPLPRPINIPPPQKQRRGWRPWDWSRAALLHSMAPPSWCDTRRPIGTRLSDPSLDDLLSLAHLFKFLLARITTSSASFFSFQQCHLRSGWQCGWHSNLNFVVYLVDAFKFGSGSRNFENRTQSLAISSLEKSTSEPDLTGPRQPYDHVAGGCG